MFYILSHSYKRGIISTIKLIFTVQKFEYFTKILRHQVTPSMYMKIIKIYYGANLRNLLTRIVYLHRARRDTKANVSILKKETWEVVRVELGA